MLGSLCGGERIGLDREQADEIWHETKNIKVISPILNFKPWACSLFYVLYSSSQWLEIVYMDGVVFLFFRCVESNIGKQKENCVYRLSSTIYRLSSTVCVLVHARKLTVESFKASKLFNPFTAEFSQERAFFEPFNQIFSVTMLVLAKICY